MNKQHPYRDDNFAAYIEEMEIVLDEQIFNVSPVVKAVLSIRERFAQQETRSKPRAAFEITRDDMRGVATTYFAAFAMTLAFIL